MKNLIPKLGCALVACGLVATPVWAQSIGVNFVGRDSAQSTLQPSQTAGIVPQANWNNIAGEPFSGGPTPLATDSGDVVLVTLTWEANDSWRHDGALPATPTGDDILMKGIHKANPDPDTDEASSFMRFTFDGLLAGSTYDVIAYVAHNGAGGEADMTVGNTTYYVTCQSPYTPPWVQGTATTPAGRSEANYVRWNNVTPAADGTLLVQAKKNIVTPQVTDGIGVSGIQLIRLTGEWPGTPPPTITGQPADVLTVAGTAVSFTVTLNGPWAVQWQKNGVNIPGATSTTYSLTAALADNGATYSAVVTNPIGTVTSREALIEVDAPAPEQLTRGFLKVEHYGGITGTAVIPFYSDPRYTTRSYDYATYAFGANVPQTVPDLNDFARIVYGWVQPPTSGQWRFFTRSDDASEIHFDVGVTHPAAITDPHNRLPVAEETGCCAAFQAPGAEETSDPFALTAGTRYAFMALYKEGGGGDFLQVAWREEADTTAPASLAPISPLSVWTMASPAGQRAEITQQPTPQTAQAGRTATFTTSMVTRPTANLFGVQWMRNGVDIPGANALAYRTPLLTMADNGAVFAAKFYTMRGEVLSSNATLTVVPDTAPPGVVGAGAVARYNSAVIDIGIEFDEGLGHASAINLANYSISRGTITGVSHYEFVSQAEHDSVKLAVTGLANGDAVTVTVTGVSDRTGNAITTPVQVSATVNTSVKWVAVGGDRLAATPPAGSTASDWVDDVIPLGDGGFNLISSSAGHWNDYDEQTFVYEELTGDFTRVVLVEFQDITSQWARQGLMAREDLNAGEDPMTGTAARNLNIRVNPATTAAGGAGNNGTELIRRITTGGNYEGAGGAGRVPLYGEQWLRIRREGNTLLVDWSVNDGATWSAAGTWTPGEADDPIADTLFVGPFYAPEMNNNDTAATLLHSAVARFRHYGEAIPVMEDIMISMPSVGAEGITVTWTGGGEAEVAESITGPWTPTGNTSGTFTLPLPEGAGGGFLRIQRP